MNAYQSLIRAAKEAAEHDAREHDRSLGRSFPIRRRDGDTEYVEATIGPRGGVQFTRRIEAGWVLDHPADFGAPSY